MEKKEAIREWCVEKALALEASVATATRVEVQKVIDTAKTLEKYITA